MNTAKNPLAAALLNIVPLGFGYLYLGYLGKFVGTLMWGVASILIGFLLGPVLVDGVLSSLDDCLGPFSPNCPRPVWAYVITVIVWGLPVTLVGLFTAFSARRNALVRNAAIKLEGR